MGRLTSRSSELESVIITDSVRSAKAAGLRYVSDAAPGITRKRSGDSFIYHSPDGKRIRDVDELARIRKLAIPPAWTDVWICPVANGHLQATGRDAKGRKQYRYHPNWRQVRDENKYHRMILFGSSLPMIRERCDGLISSSGLSREKVLAAVVLLLERTLIRIGNEEYARANGSFGLTTMQDRHVKIIGSRVRFQFRGKSGIKHAIDVSDRRLARIVKRCRDIDGYDLFQYLDDAGNGHTIGSGDVNDFLRQISGHDFTAKDFRTWGGTVFAAIELAGCEPCESQAHGKRMVARAIESVATKLGNTPAICRKCYVHPAVIEAYLEGSIHPIGPRLVATTTRADSPYALRPEESAVFDLLRGDIS